jgi:hypothetical protein
MRRAPIAQLVEQLPFKETVPGSNPGGGTPHGKGIHSYFHFAPGDKETVPGSNPGGDTMLQ